MEKVAKYLPQHGKSAASSWRGGEGWLKSPDMAVFVCMDDNDEKGRNECLKRRQLQSYFGRVA